MSTLKISYQFYNPGENILNKIVKSSKTGQDKKSLIYTLCVFDGHCQSLIFGRETLGTRLCLHPNLRFS